MKTYALLFLCTIICSVDAFAGLGGNIAVKDNREYGELSDPVYSSVARFDSNGEIKCTAGFVWENIIVTNHHCADLCVRNRCSIYFWDGNKYQTSDVHILALPREYKTTNGTDWAIFKTDVPNKNFKEVAPFTTMGNVSRGGFGLMRLIPDNEIPIIRKALAEAKKSDCKEGDEWLSCVNRKASKILEEKYNLKPLFKDKKNFKIQNCMIHSYFEPGRVKTSCDSSGGDSGAPLLRGNQLVAMNNAGSQTIFSDSELNGAYAINTNNFYNMLQIIISHEKSFLKTDNLKDVFQDDNIITDPQEIQRQAEQRLLNCQCD